MSLLDEVIKSNRIFVTTPQSKLPTLPKNPKMRAAIFTCMDTRLVDFLEPAMGIRRGDVKVIKNAGNIILDPTGGVIRSLVVAIFMLGVEEIFVIGHYDCGMASVDPDRLKSNMIARGIAESAIDKIEPSFIEWIGAFANPEKNVRAAVEMIRSSPLMPKDVPVHGLLFCPSDGHLEVVVRGY